MAVDYFPFGERRSWLVPAWPVEGALLIHLSGWMDGWKERLLTGDSSQKRGAEFVCSDSALKGWGGFMVKLKAAYLGGSRATPH